LATTTLRYNGRYF